MGRRAALIIILSAISCLLHSHPGKGELTRLFHPAKDGSSLALLAVGDWGRNGTFNQSLVSSSSRWEPSEKTSTSISSFPPATISTKAASPMSTINPSSTPSPIYTLPQACRSSVLGNHDYRGNVLAQLDPILRMMDSRWFCMRSFVVDAEIANLFFLDTTPFVKKYWKHPKKNHYDWREVAPRKRYISRLLKDLKIALAESAATWKIVIGHHTLRSVSEHGETPELVKLLLPMLIEYDVDIYINGHDHCLQHISSNDSFIQFLTSGGGSKAWRGIVVPTNENLRFFYDGQGFVSLQLSTTDALIKFYDVFGVVLHEWSITKEIYDYIV